LIDRVENSFDRGTTRHSGLASSSSLAVRVATVAVVGLGVGVITSILQKYLNSPWDSLVNAASPWLTPMFFLGVLWRRPSSAALAGLATGLLELVGYYTTASIRGYPAGHSILLFWGLCAVVGGPVFGAAGWAWWSQREWRSDLGASVLPAAFFAEALVAYGIRLHYGSSAILFAILGVGAVAVVGLFRHQPGPVVKWLLLTFPIGVAAEFILGVVYNQSF
jgi:Family of unknown function (DUF6518)